MRRIEVQAKSYVCLLDENWTQLRKKYSLASSFFYPAFGFIVPR